MVDATEPPQRRGSLLRNHPARLHCKETLVRQHSTTVPGLHRPRQKGVRKAPHGEANAEQEQKNRRKDGSCKASEARKVSKEG